MSFKNHAHFYQKLKTDQLRLIFIKQNNNVTKVQKDTIKKPNLKSFSYTAGKYTYILQQKPQSA